MKIGVMTGITKLDDVLQNKIKQVSVIHYPEMFFQDADITIAIVSAVKNMDMLFEDFLYELRKRNIRVIVLLPNEMSEYMNCVLSLGITDIIFDPIDTDKIISKIKYPTSFSSIAKYYMKDRVYVPSGVDPKLKNDNSQSDLAKEQVLKLFDFFNKKVDSTKSINELLALLENEVIKKNI